MSSALDALLHPVRWRVIQRLASGPLTTRELHEQLGDVALATLYRQMGPLVDAGLVRVVEEWQVRGATERCYALGRGLESSDLVTLDDFRRVALFLLASLQADVEAYLTAGPDDPAADGLSLTRTVVHVDDDQLKHLQQGLRELLEPLLARGQGRRPLTVGLLAVPGVE